MLILKLEGLIEKISYNRYIYESLDNRSLSLITYKKDEKLFHQKRVNLTTETPPTTLKWNYIG